jgi:hypothetical protein
MSLELKRKELEIVKVAARRAELEFTILEKEEEIKRIKDQIQTQLQHEAKLKEDLKKAKG